jgi:hypothetical protein
MNREIHVPLREGLGVQFPRATRPLRKLLFLLKSPKKTIDRADLSSSIFIPQRH